MTILDPAPKTEIDAEWRRQMCRRIASKAWEEGGDQVRDLLLELLAILASEGRFEEVVTTLLNTAAGQYQVSIVEGPL